MAYREQPRTSESIETVGVWYAACASVTFALVAFLPSLPLRAMAIAAGLMVTCVFARAYLKVATPFTAAVVTVTAASCSTAAVVWLSGLPWKTGISWSQAGGVGRATAWLFTTTALCFGVGALATGRLMLRHGYRCGYLRRKGYRLVSALPWLSFAGFAAVALFPVGGAPILSIVHNVASWVALGSFWVGMVATPWLRALPRTLRHYSAGAAVLVFGMWLPNGLRFMGFIDARPISMLAMEIVVFPLCFIWFCWLAWEWSPGASVSISDPGCHTA